MTISGPLFLVGMMGAGKSTVGALLARELDLPFIDTDAEIERRAGRSIPEIFAQDGEPAFRELERKLLQEASEGPAVIALGGGAIDQPGLIEALDALGDSIYLEVPASKLLERIGDPESRPLLAGLERGSRRDRLDELLAERRACYERARYRVDADETPERVVARILKLLDERG